MRSSYSGGRHPEGSRRHVARTEQQLKRRNPLLWNDEKQKVRLLQVAGCMRLGEEQNCCAVNTPRFLSDPDSWGRHSYPAGGLDAPRCVLEEILQEHPDDQQARWLLNVAAMTLGKYPDGVPGQWRISPRVFQSEYDIKRFPNIASQVGLNILGLCGRRGGGRPRRRRNLDVMVSALGLEDQLRYFHNNGDATFTERTKEAKLTGRKRAART